MKLLFELDSETLEVLKLSEQETIAYCVPYDLALEAQSHKALKQFHPGYLVVTNLRLLVVYQKTVEKSVLLSECEKVKCESQVGCGIISVTKKDTGLQEVVLRFSMRHMVRISYVARGADVIAKGETQKIVSTEKEQYCERCGRVLPGTSTCMKCGGGWASFRKLRDLCRGFEKQLLIISLLMSVSAMMYIVSPFIQKWFIDEKLADRSGTLADIGVFAGLMFLCTTVEVTIYLTQYWMCVNLGAKLSMSLRNRLYMKIQALSLSFINRRQAGELMNRITGDTQQVRNFIQETFGSMFQTLLTMVASFVVMMMMDWKLTLMSLMFIAVVAVLIRLFWKRVRKVFHMQWVRSDKISNNLQDIISGIRVVKSFGKEQEEAENFAELTRDFAKLRQKNETFFAMFYPMLTFIMGIGSYFAIYFGGMNVLDGSMTVGELTQFVTYTGFIYGPLGWMTNLPRSVMQMLTSLNRIYDVLDEMPAIQDREDAVEMEIKGDISVKDLSFGYHSYEPVLEHIDLEVKQGEMIGLVGASGTGKSTMINLLMRLYDADQGSISIDGVDIRDIKRDCLHGQLGVVLQETFLFSGSILENIRYAKPDATYQETIMAAKAANAHDFICKMPDGYNTYVGEHGYNLSGGERQRIAIARAILNNPKLLILDEATSALDTESEFLIQQALDRLTEGRTTFAIAHRLSTLRNASRLVVLDGHNVAEVGTHNELLEKKGLYYGLVTAQLQMSEMEIEQAAEALEEIPAESSEAVISETPAASEVVIETEA